MRLCDNDPYTGVPRAEFICDFCGRSEKVHAFAITKSGFSAHQPEGWTYKSFEAPKLTFWDRLFLVTPLPPGYCRYDGVWVVDTPAFVCDRCGKQP